MTQEKVFNGWNDCMRRSSGTGGMQIPMTFDGNTYEPELDQERLTTSYQKIFNFMSDGAWHKLKTLAFVGDCSEAGASARIRDFRKIRNGSHTVNSKRLSGGTWVYQLIKNTN